jgi:hypothetical protein
MSTVSFALSKRGSKWHATGTLPSGKPFDVDCGAVSRDAANEVAKIKVAGKFASSQGSVDWHRARKAARAAGASSMPAAPKSPPRPSNEDLRAKLVSRGAPPAAPPVDAAPPTDEPPAIDPDEVIPPGDHAGKGAASEEDAMSDEEQELFAKGLAEGTAEFMEGAANWIQRKRKPPREGEAGERSKRWVCKGSEYYWRKLVGRATLSPAAMLGLGTLGIFVGVALSATPVNAAPPAQAAAPAPAPAAAAPAGATNGANGAHAPSAAADADERALVPAGSPLGTFEDITKRKGPN